MVTFSVEWMHGEFLTVMFQYSALTQIHILRTVCDEVLVEFYLQGGWEYTLSHQANDTVIVPTRYQDVRSRSFWLLEGKQKYTAKHSSPSILSGIFIEA